MPHLRDDLPDPGDRARRRQRRRGRGQVQLLHGVHPGLPDGLDRRVARGRDAVLARAAVRLDRAARAGRGRGRGAGGHRSLRRRRGRSDRRAARRGAQRGGRQGEGAGIGREAHRQPVQPRPPGRGDGAGQLPAHGRGLGLGRAPHHPRLRRQAVPGARGPVARHRRAGRGRPGPRAPAAPVLGVQPARRRAARLPQRVADGEARRGRGVLELPVRPRQGATPFG